MVVVVPLSRLRRLGKINEERALDFASILQGNVIPRLG
jgi:hypothetical protein